MGYINRIFTECTVFLCQGNPRTPKDTKLISLYLRLIKVTYSFLFSHSERRYEDLCRNIINDMNQYGLSVVDDFLGMEKGLKILNEVRSMYTAGAFQDGQVVQSQSSVRGDKIRGDKIKWVAGNEPGCSNVWYLTNQVRSLSLSPDWFPHTYVCIFPFT